MRTTFIQFARFYAESRNVLIIASVVFFIENFPLFIVSLPDGIDGVGQDVMRVQE